MAEKRQYGAGLIGAGWVAGEYVKALRDHPQTHIAGIYNRTPGRAADLLERHNVVAQEYATLDDFFADHDIDIVISCTHPHVRADHCVRAAESGRHIVIEKPVAITPSDVNRVRNAVAISGVKTVTSFVLRWNPQFVTVRKLIDDGVVGDLIYGEADYWHPVPPHRAGGPYLSKDVVGSAVLSGGCHAVDMLRYLGGEIVEVSAHSAAGKRTTAFDFDPVTVASVTFANGAVGKVSTLMDGDTPYRFNCRLFGTEGTIQNNRVFSSSHYPGATDYWAFPTIEPNSGDVAHHPFRAEIDHFIECLDEDVESHASIHDTYKSMAVCFAIDESAEQGGKPVRVKLD